MNTSRALLTGIAALFLVTGAAHTTAAHAEITEQLMPTDKWIKYCRGGADPSAKWYQWVCSVYIKGVSDGLIVSDKICAPNSMTIQKAMDVVIAKGKPGIRQDRNGHTTVWIINNLARDHSPSISGTCVFSFKDLRTGAPEGEEQVVNLKDAVIPVNSILVFEPIDQNRCVSEYRVRLVIKRMGKEERVVEFGYGDPGCGKCLTKFVFNCIESN